jgi:RNA polymerase primary sigma factor
MDNSIQKYIQTVGDSQPLSPAEEQALAKNIQNNVRVEESVTKLFLSNLRIVSSIAQEFSNMGVATIDLISEGNTGLMIAARKFKPNRKAKFATYATYWVKQRIRQSLAKHSKDVRVPTYLVERQLRLTRVEYELTQQLGRPPTDQEICQKMKLSARQLKSARLHATSCLSLDDDHQGQTTPLRDQLPDNAPDLERSKQLESLDRLVHNLTRKEREIISLRYGLNTKKQTLVQLGKKYGVSRERIRQIETKALQKLNKWLGQEEF